MDLSVIMAVHNQAETLDEAISSIAEQTYSDFVFFIVDDGSHDKTSGILKEWQGKDKRIRVITNNQQLGLTKSLNIILNLVKTKFIVRMDGDDIALPDRFKKQRQYLLSHPKIALLGTAVQLMDGNGKLLRVKSMPTGPEKIRQMILSYCPFIHPTWMVRRSVLDAVGRYNESFPYAQDYELALRIVSCFSAANLAEPLLQYRVNSASAISMKRLKQQELLALKARYLGLTRFGYRWSEAWRLIKPVLSFLVPAGIKKLVYQQYFWQ